MINADFIIYTWWLNINNNKKVTVSSLTVKSVLDPEIERLEKKLEKLKKLKSELNIVE